MGLGGGVESETRPGHCQASSGMRGESETESRGTPDASGGAGVKPQEIQA